MFSEISSHMQLFYVFLQTQSAHLLFICPLFIIFVHACTGSHSRCSNVWLFRLGGSREGRFGQKSRRLLKVVLLAISSRGFLCSDSFRERTCLWLWICLDNLGVLTSGMGLCSETRFGFGYTVRVWAFGLYIGESIANAGMGDSFGIV